MAEITTDQLGELLRTHTNDQINTILHGTSEEISDMVSRMLVAELQKQVDEEAAKKEHEILFGNGDREWPSGILVNRPRR